MSFVIGSWAVFWSGWETLIVAVLAILIPSVLFLCVEWGRGRAVQFWGGTWWFVYLAGLCLAAGLFGDNRPFMLPFVWQMTVVGVFAVAIFPLAVRTRLERVAPEAEVAMEPDV